MPIVAFSWSKAQQGWALDHNENKKFIFVGLAARAASLAKDVKKALLIAYPIIKFVFEINIIEIKGWIYLLKCRRLAICLLLCLPLFVATGKLVFATEVNISMKCDTPTPVADEEFVISFILTPHSDTNISAYRIKLYFDSSKLVYKGLYSDINYDDFASYVNGDLLTILYVTRDRGFDVKAGQSEVIVDLTFKVLKHCNIGDTEISAQIDGLCNYDAQEISIIGVEPINVTVVQTGEAVCDLASLETEGYRIVPAFSSDVTQYSVEVPYSKSTIEFMATPLDDSATVKASRKTLKSAGTTTDINLTVSSEDKKSKKVYTVTVSRLTKAETEIKKLNTAADSDEEDDTVATKTRSVRDVMEESNENKKLGENDDTVSRVSINDKENSYTKTPALPLIVAQNGFNIAFFAGVAIVFVAIAIFVIKQKY